jgi:LysM repeat protein
MAFVTGTHIIHTVRPGDHLYTIADRYQSDVGLIERVNAIYPPFTEPGLIFPGQVLVIPHLFNGRNQTLYVVQPGETLFAIGQRFTTYPDLIAGITDGVQNPQYIFPNQQVRLSALIYEVQPGDSFSAIAEKTGVPLQVILSANQNRPGISPDLIYEGVRLVIPLPVSQNIVVFEPAPGSEIERGIYVEGYARAFEATVLHQIQDTNQVIVAEEDFTTAHIGAPAYGFFSTTIPFDRSPTAPTGQLWVYTRSPVDDSIQDLVQIPVSFA